MPARKNRPDKCRSEPTKLAPPPAPEPAAEDLPHPLVAQIRPFTAGKSALFVGNRNDPNLKAHLEDRFDLKVTWCEGDPRRIQAQCDSIAHSSYDLVLLATGFQGHSADGVLGRAARAVGVPFVRVFKGRSLACARALARTFGLAESTA